MNFIESEFSMDPWVVITGIYYGLAILLSIGILLENRNPPKTIAYLLVLFLFPYFGLVVYILFGQNLKKQKLFKRKNLMDNEKVKTFSEEILKDIVELEPELESILGTQLKTAKALLKNENALLTLNNQVTLLKNGEVKFPLWMEALKSAVHHIHLDYYIIESGPLLQKVIDLLIDKRKEGVEVRIIYDAVGSTGFNRSDINKLKASGVLVAPFMPVLFPNFTSKANFRDHRKITVVDGKVGFVGGINLSSRYSNSYDNKLYWRDTHLKIEGDAVKGLQLAFYLNWEFVHNEKLGLDATYFPESDLSDLILTQIATSGPDSDWAGIMYGIFSAINNAKDYVYITTPYFIPNEALNTALLSAALSGVDVRILIPKKADTFITQAASMSYMKPLLKAGVRVYLYEKGFVHAKTLVVDDQMATVGTANFDNRSFDINFEINAFVYDEDFAIQVKEMFLEDCNDCESLWLSRWDKRTIRKRIIESLARLIAPIL